MATYIIVDKDQDPLGPNEIHAGQAVDVTQGDVFIISASANDNIQFVSASGTPTNFEIRFETSNANAFSVEVMGNLDAGVVIASDTALPDVDIKAQNALSVIMTAGDNVSLGRYEGSDAGVDVVTIGNGFTTNHDILLRGGDNYLTIGDNASIQKIISEEGADTIIVGEGLTADDISTGDGDDALSIGAGATLVDINTGDGNDTVELGDNLNAHNINTGHGSNSLTIGDGATLNNIQTGVGDDTISIGNDLIANDIKTGDGADALSIGDNALLDNIDTGKGNDTVSVGDFFTADKLETKDGDDLVISGAGGSIGDLDGGNGNDTLDSETNYPGATSFEIICFARRTLIETDNGNVPVEKLRKGDLVRTVDHGMQPIRWIGSTQVAGTGVHAPVRIAAGVLGNAQALWVSQQHRMLLSGWKVELHFGEPEVLVPAKHLVHLPGIEIIELSSVEYFHVLFDQHEIVFAECIESESFHPGALGMQTLSDEAKAELHELFPELATDPNSYGDSARLSLKSFEARILAV